MGHKRLDSSQKDKKTQFEGNNTPRSSLRMKCSYIHSSFFKYKMFSLFFFFFFVSDYIPHFSQESFLYIVLFLFNPSLPSVDCISDLLDACPIRALLEPLCVVVKLNITVQTSFSHKCGQLVRCRTFNVVIATFFSNISWFIVDSFIWSLSLEAWYPLARYSLGNRALIPHNVSQGSLDPQETTFVRHYLSLSSSLCSTSLSYYLTLLRLPYILGLGPQPNTLTQLIYPHRRHCNGITIIIHKFGYYI